jgi:hypothetical protein
VLLPAAGLLAGATAHFSFSIGFSDLTSATASCTQGGRGLVIRSLSRGSAVLGRDTLSGQDEGPPVQARTKKA